MEFLPIGFLEFGIKDLLETLAIAIVIVLLYRWIRGSFAIPVVIGLSIVFLVNGLVSLFGLTTINFLLRRMLDVGVIAVIIIFQPEIRKLLYNIGQNTSLYRFFDRGGSFSVIEEVIEAVKSLSRSKTGALIVFSKGTALNDLVDSGVKIDAKVSSELLLTIFNKDTPLHDGAVIIRDNKIFAASAYLPISQNPSISSVFGTRHRAALGISEVNDVLVLVVSEETGRVSVAHNGSLTSGMTIQKLRYEMEKHLGETKDEDKESSSFRQSELEL
ncbi:diadenylate cyclase CdaA [Balneolaceae bacterium ANBcel3]|nr:diadenylate cyclase CdaA [Balneolaceae bacterium ANBcel3]